MALLDDILAHNANWVEERQRPMSRSPRKKVLIFTCMDTRLVEFLEQAMGLGRGDAKVIKNAGNTLVDSGGGVVRSVVVAVFLLGCEEIFVIGHTDCAMANIDEDGLEAAMRARGVSSEAISSLRKGLHEWVGAFHDPRGNVARVVKVLRESPLLPRDLPVHGLMFCPDTGKLEVVERGAGSAA